MFTCRRCGYCCQGETTVSLNDDDRARMVAFLGLSEEETSARYWRVTDGCVQMKTVDGHCIFYNEGCSVHEARPWRCAQWPLHPAILLDPANLSAIRESCPGLRQEVSYDEFCRILKENQEDMERGHRDFIL
ncbi:MAG: YkgJ family cysteine cluster protein [Desulfocapsaceae bacterium]|nr:YkgJ family cysteine cluster protein [Desulfocapsaceae bacterium]